MFSTQLGQTVTGVRGTRQDAINCNYTILQMIQQSYIIKTPVHFTVQTNNKVS